MTVRHTPSDELTTTRMSARGVRRAKAALSRMCRYEEQAAVFARLHRKSHVPERQGFNPRTHPRPRAEPRGKELPTVSHRDRNHHTRAYSITSSASICIETGTSIPSALAVFKLMTSSNFVGCRTGRSAGFLPIRIWPVRAPPCRYRSSEVAP